MIYVYPDIAYVSPTRPSPPMPEGLGERAHLTAERESFLLSLRVAAGPRAHMQSNRGGRSSSPPKDSKFD